MDLGNPWLNLLFLLASGLAINILTRPVQLLLARSSRRTTKRMLDRDAKKRRWVEWYSENPSALYVYCLYRIILGLTFAMCVIVFATVAIALRVERSGVGPIISGASGILAVITLLVFTANVQTDLGLLRGIYSLKGWPVPGDKSVPAPLLIPTSRPDVHDSTARPTSGPQEDRNRSDR